MNSFLIVPDGYEETWTEVLEFLSNLEGTDSWSAYFARFVLLKSTRSATFVIDRLAERFPGMRFVVAEVDTDRVGGSMPGQFWKFVKTSPAERLAS